MSDNNKANSLKVKGILNDNPERIVHSMLLNSKLFDPLDLIQVQYEMLRAVRVEGVSVSEACRLFGYSREYYCRLEQEFNSKGFAGIIGLIREKLQGGLTLTDYWNT